MTLPQVIDSISIVAPFGVCFHDAATGERVLDGLNVSLFNKGNGNYHKEFSALPNRVGVYVLQKAVGLKYFLDGATDRDFWQQNPPHKLFTVEVLDLENRFQPFRFIVKLPVKGLYEWESSPFSSPNKNSKSVPLYSSPTRKVTGGMAIVRAELRDENENPAAWAVLEARFSGNLIARGIAGRDGKIALIFPSLPPQNNPFTSPPSNAVRVSLEEQKWNIDLTVKYQPNVFHSSPPDLVQNKEEILPDLRLALSQTVGKLWADVERTKEFTTATLHLGRELILRSSEKILSPMADTNRNDTSFLFVSPVI